MALRSKAIKGSGLTKLRPAISSSEGTTRTETESWTGPYAQLKAKQDAVILSAKATSLVPTEADHGLLTITTETDISTSNEATQPNQTTTEVVWEELRKPLETHKFFKDLTPQEILDVKKAVENGEGVPSEGEVLFKFWEKLSRGVTEWSTGVPVVRRTTTKRTGNEAKGGAWFRDDPPVDVAGDWEFLKTADETRREGRSYTRVEEWTGAEEWDEDLYPTSEEGGGEEEP